MAVWQHGQETLLCENLSLLDVRSSAALDLYTCMRLPLSDACLGLPHGTASVATSTRW